LAWYEANSEVKTFVVKANRPVLALRRKSPGETEKTTTGFGVGSGVGSGTLAKAIGLS